MVLMDLQMHKKLKWMKVWVLEEEWIETSILEVDFQQIFQLIIFDFP